MRKSPRTILVTGSSSGIGRAVAERLLAEDWSVVGLARDHSKFQPEQDKYSTHCCDLSDLDALPACLAEILESRPDINGVVSNAGAGFMGHLEQLSCEQIRKSTDLNLTSHMLVARAAIPHLKKLGHGDLVFMGSQAGLRGTPQGSLYCAAKFGMRGFAQSLRLECAKSGVRVGIVQPGMVRTPFFDTLTFEPGPEKDNAIEVADVAEAVFCMLNMRQGTVVDELVVSPLKKNLQFKK